MFCFFLCIRSVLMCLVFFLLKIMVPLNFLLSTIIQQYLATKCVIMITDSPNSSLTVPFGTILVNVDVGVSLNKISKIVFGNFACQHFILNVKALNEVFSAIEQELPKHQESFNKRKYVIINHSKNALRSFFENSGMNFVTDLVFANVRQLSSQRKLLWPNEDDIEVTFWTHRYFGLRDNNHPIMIDRWFSTNKTFLFGNDIFYEKVRNHQGRAVKVAVFDVWPYIILGNNSVGKMAGVEIRLLETLMNYINATAEFYMETEMWGRILPNGSSFGLKGRIFNGNAEIALAGIYLAEDVVQNLDYTAPYLRAEITCLVPNPRLAPPWLSPYYSFTTDIWILLLSTYVQLCGIIYVVIYYEVYRRTEFKQKPSKAFVIKETLVIMGKLTIFQLSPGKLHSTIKKLMFPVLLATISLSIAYTAGYASIMTKPKYEAAINTVEDFLKSDIEWGGQQTEELILNWKYGEEGSYKKVGERYLSLSNEQLGLLSKRGDMAFKLAQTFGIPHIPDYFDGDTLENYRIMKGDLFTQYIIAILRKNSVLLPVMNNLATRMKENGLIMYWVKHSESSLSAIRRKLLKANVDGKNPENLRLLHVLGAFVVLLIGFFLASIIFAIELLKQFDFL